MQNRNSPLSPEVWLHDLFTSKAVQEGAGMASFLREIDRRGYQAIENSGQILIFCNRAPIRWLTGPDPISSKEIGPKSLQDFGARADARTRPALTGRHR